VQKLGGTGTRASNRARRQRLVHRAGAFCDSRHVALIATV